MHGHRTFVRRCERRDYLIDVEWECLGYRGEFDFVETGED